MVKAVFVQGTSSDYDDQPGRYYHFPKRYLRRVQESLGDWVVFFTPVKDSGVDVSERGTYRGTARLVAITPDPQKTDHYYVSLERPTVQDFAVGVPRIMNGDFLEPALAGKDGGTNTGVALQAVRHISDATFDKIIAYATQFEATELPRFEEATEDFAPGFADEATHFLFDHDRQTIASLTNKRVRDRRFRLAVLRAYDKKCAITGWDFTNGGGRAEVEAAHIIPIEYDGRDVVNNGLALSGTVHWMFDRGLVSIADNDEILISSKVNDKDSIERILNPSGRLLRPPRQAHQPHNSFLEWHRRHHGFAA
ncbi:HNH endonuclease [Henriciella sp.]|uniref:HNH endonuclease n=1 Tax=Henriciella sp. TaxID=1968823 RepID=UPI00260F5BCB|nr:HNH endonuclease [Henriciella sp.]